MKKLYAIYFMLILLTLPGTAFATCECVCTFTGCGDTGPAPSLSQNVADQSACENLCRSSEPDLGCTGSTNVCRDAGTLPGGETSEGSIGSGADLRFEPPLGDLSIQEIIGRVVQAILGIVGSIALLMFVIGGFIWMTAAGSAERVNLGKNILVWSIIGLAVIFAAYAITQFVLTALLQ